MQKSKTKFSAELSHKVDIEIPFLSNPTIDNGSITISKSHRNLDLQSNEFSLQIENTSLNLTFHAKDIKVNGQKVVFTINSFQEDHKGNYTINFTTSDNLTSSYVIEVIPSGR